MVKLTPAEFAKPNSKTGEARVDILIRLIKDGKPVELVNGTKIVIQNSPELISNLEQWRDDDSDRKAAVGFVDIKGNPYTTTDLGKSAVFGGGGGAAVGALADLEHRAADLHFAVHPVELLPRGKAVHPDVATPAMDRQWLAKLLLDSTMRGHVAQSDAGKVAVGHAPLTPPDDSR